MIAPQFSIADSLRRTYACTKAREVAEELSKVPAQEREYWLAAKLYLILKEYGGALEKVIDHQQKLAVDIMNCSPAPIILTRKDTK